MKKKQSKMAQARSILNSCTDKSRGNIVPKLCDRLGMSKAMAGTYFQLLKKPAKAKAAKKVKAKAKPKSAKKSVRKSASRATATPASSPTSPASSASAPASA